MEAAWESKCVVAVVFIGILDLSDKLWCEWVERRANNDEDDGIESPPTDSAYIYNS